MSIKRYSIKGADWEGILWQYYPASQTNLPDIPCSTKKHTTDVTEKIFVSHLQQSTITTISCAVNTMSAELLHLFGLEQQSNIMDDTPH